VNPFGSTLEAGAGGSRGPGQPELNIKTCLKMGAKQINNQACGLNDRAEGPEFNSQHFNKQTNNHKKKQTYITYIMHKII
jgi:hypothetical protein